METGQTILTILLLILVIALGFSYSEEVSSNRTLRAQLKKPSPEVYWLKIRIGDLGQRLAEQEAEIVCKDEEIKRLTESHRRLEDVLPNSLRSDKLEVDHETLLDNIDKAQSFNALYRGEWVDESDYINDKED